MATFYGTTGGATAYYTAHGMVDDQATDTDLQIASEWIDGAFYRSFPGVRFQGRAQAREWPRSGAFDIYGYGIDPATVPTEIEQATYFLAAINNASPGALNVVFTPAEGLQQISIDGALSVTFTGATSLSDVQLQIPQVQQILYPILTGNATFAGGVSSPAIRG